MSLTKHTERLRGFARAFLRKDGQDYLLPLPSADAVFSSGVTEQIQRLAREDGVVVPVDQYTSEQDPQVALTFTAGPGRLEVLEPFLAFQMAVATESISVPLDFEVPSSLRRPPDGTDLLFGDLDTNFAFVSTKGTNGLPELLTRSTDFSTSGFGTDSTDTGGFMLGTDGDFFFTPDLESRSVVALLQTSPLEVSQLTTTELGFYEVYILMADTSGFQYSMSIPKAKVILGGLSLDVKPESVELTFRIFRKAGEPLLYQFRKIPKRAS